MRGRRSLEKEWSELQIQVRRFLKAHVGQPWVAVQRGFHARFDPPGSLGRMLRQYLPELVALDVTEQGGELVRPGRDGLQPLSEACLPGERLYACPQTGLLRRFSSGNSRHRVVLSEHEIQRQIGKRWYQITLAPLADEPASRVPCFDVVLGCLVNQPSRQLNAKLHHLYGRPGVFAASKRQVHRSLVAR